MITTRLPRRPLRVLRISGSTLMGIHLPPVPGSVRPTQLGATSRRQLSTDHCRSYVVPMMS